MRFMLRALAALALLLPGSAEAAQFGRVVTEGAPIHLAADPYSPVLDRVIRGQVLRISQWSKRSWHQVLLPNPTPEGVEYGWIKETDLLSDRMVKEREDAGIQSFGIPVSTVTTSPRWSLSALAGISFTKPGDLQATAGSAEEFTAGRSFGLELRHTAILNHLSVGARFEFHKLNNPGYSAGGTIGALMVDFEYIYAPPWHFTAGLGVGSSFDTEWQGAGQLGPESTPRNVLTLLARLSFHYFPESRLGLTVSAGLRYLRTGGGDPIPLNLTGPYGEAGFQVLF